MSTILGLSGSLRSGSYDTSVLHAAAELVPDGVTLGVVVRLRAAVQLRSMSARGPKMSMKLGSRS